MHSHQLLHERNVSRSQRKKILPKNLPIYDWQNSIRQYLCLCPGWGWYLNKERIRESCIIKNSHDMSILLPLFLLKISSSSLLSSFHRHQPKKPLSFFVVKWILYPSNESRPHFLPFMFQASNLLIILSLSPFLYLLDETTSVKNKPPSRTSLSYTCHSPVLSVWDSVQWWETVSHTEHDK